MNDLTPKDKRVIREFLRQANQAVQEDGPDYITFVNACTQAVGEFLRRKGLA